SSTNAPHHRKPNDKTRRVPCVYQTVTSSASFDPRPPRSTLFPYTTLFRSLATLLMLHLMVVAFWFGALWPLIVASLRETPARASDIIERFTAVATWLVPVILLTGIVIAVLLLPSVSALREPYGELLIAKLVGFAVLMGLAAANKWRLGPALAHGRVQTGRWF